MYIEIYYLSTLSGDRMGSSESYVGAMELAKTMKLESFKIEKEFHTDYLPMLLEHVGESKSKLEKIIKPLAQTLKKEIYEELVSSYGLRKREEGLIIILNYKLKRLIST